MTASNIITLWALTVLAGSILAAILHALMGLAWHGAGGMDPLFPGLFFWALFSAICSSFCSLPAMAVLWAVNENLKAREAPAAKALRVLTAAHVACAAVTFAVLAGFTTASFRPFLLACGIAYASTGIVLWRREIKSNF